MNLVHTAEVCRICDAPELTEVLDLGVHPPANSLRVARTESLPTAPLLLRLCAQCQTLQLRDTFAPDYLFSNYVWVTGTSAAATEQSHVFCRELAERTDHAGGLVVEIASNDGTYLKPFAAMGRKVLGVEPAANIAPLAEAAGIPTMVRFFCRQAADDIRAEHGGAAAVFARNVVPHVEQVHEVVSGIRTLLDADGCGAIEFHYLGKLLRELQYDAIYHEHIFYFSVATAMGLLARHGLHVFDVADSPISGGAKIVYFRRRPQTPTAALTRVLADEERAGWQTPTPYLEFGEGCRRHRDELAQHVTQLSGQRVVGYGASARSSTLLNFCQLDHRHIDCIADGNSLKHGKLTAGTDIPIVSPADAFARPVDQVLLLAWNFEAEIMAALRHQYAYVGPVIIPLPSRVRVER